jgi:hypothetical protein
MGIVGILAGPERRAIVISAHGEGQQMTASAQAQRILKQLEAFNESVGSVLDDELQGHLDSACEGLACVVEDLKSAEL